MPRQVGPAEEKTSATIGQSPYALVASALRESGIVLDVGQAAIRVRGTSPAFARQLQCVYAHFPMDTAGSAQRWADVDLRIDPVLGIRRWIRPQVQILVDGTQPFQPFPATHPLPMFEWGANMLIGQRFNHRLLLHAGVLERDDHALLLPAIPGSGKSTLSAALSISGWRLLSDEFGVYDPDERTFGAMLKPVALKNQSIDVMRQFSTEVRLGPTFHKTRKGDVAHLIADTRAVQLRHRPARPAAVVLPRWVPNTTVQLRSLDESSIFRSLAFNSFNYQTLGSVGFSAAVALARCCRGWELVYSRLEDAIEAIDRLWPEALDFALRQAEE